MKSKNKITHYQILNEVWSTVVLPSRVLEDKELSNFYRTFIKKCRLKNFKGYGKYAWEYMVNRLQHKPINSDLINNLNKIMVS